MIASDLHFTLSKGDLFESIQRTLYDSAGNTINLTGATVTFVLRRVSDGVKLFERTAVIVSALGGVVRYDWQAGDTDIAGEYLAQFVVTTGGKQYTFPNDPFILVHIRPDLQ